MVHKIGKVKNLKSLSRRLFRTTNTHQDRPECSCKDCNKDRRKGCTNPHKCAVSAYNLLAGLSQKLNPLGPSQKDGLTLTHHRLEKNARANLPRGDVILFNPSVTTCSSLADCFRVHMDHAPSSLPALRRRNNANPQPELSVFTDHQQTSLPLHNAYTSLHRVTDPTERYLPLQSLVGLYG